MRGTEAGRAASGPSSSSPLSSRETLALRRGARRSRPGRDPGSRCQGRARERRRATSPEDAGGRSEKSKGQVRATRLASVQRTTPLQARARGCRSDPWDGSHRGKTPVPVPVPPFSRTCSPWHVIRPLYVRIAASALESRHKCTGTMEGRRRATRTCQPFERADGPRTRARGEAMEGLVEIASSSRWLWATQRHAERTHRVVNTTLSTDGAKIRHERRTGALEAHGGGGGGGVGQRPRTTQGAPLGILPPGKQTYAASQPLLGPVTKCVNRGLQTEPVPRRG